MKHIVCITLALLAGLASAAAEKPTRMITVTGTAEVSVKPDICNIGLLVTHQNIKSALDAYRMNGDVMDRVMAAVKGVGLEEKDLQTANFSISPQYHWEDKSRKRVFDGYTVAHTLSVKLRDMNKVSGVLDAAMTAGVNEVSYVQFTVENPKKYTAAIRADAIKAARAKAEVMASETGVKLLKPITISETEPGNWAHLYAQSNVMAATGDYRGEAGGGEMAPGEMKLTHTVQITYEFE